MKIRLTLELEQVDLICSALSFYLVRSTFYDPEALARIRRLFEYLDRRRGETEETK